MEIWSNDSISMHAPFINITGQRETIVYGGLTASIYGALETDLAGQRAFWTADGYLSTAPTETTHEHSRRMELEKKIRDEVKEEIEKMKKEWDENKRRIEKEKEKAAEEQAKYEAQMNREN